MVDYIQFAYALSVPLIRGLSGWFENAAEDHKIDWPEISKLIATVIRIGTLSTFAYFGITGFGFDVDAISVACGTAAVDFLISKLRPKIAKKK